VIRGFRDRLKSSARLVNRVGPGETFKTLLVLFPKTDQALDYPAGVVVLLF